MISSRSSAEKSKNRSFKYPSRATKRAASVCGGSAAIRQRSPAAVHPAVSPMSERVTRKASKNGRAAPSRSDSFRRASTAFCRKRERAGFFFVWFMGILSVFALFWVKVERG